MASVFLYSGRYLPLASVVQTARGSITNTEFMYELYAVYIQTLTDLQRYRTSAGLCAV